MRSSSVWTLTLVLLGSLGAVNLLSVELVAENPVDQKQDAQDQDAQDQGTPKGSPHIIAIVEGTPVTIEMYQQFLLEKEGLAQLDALLDRVLLGREAKRLKISFPYEEVEHRIDARIERLTKIFGDEKSFAASLHKHQGSIAAYRRWLEQDFLWELVADRVVLVERADPANSTPPTAADRRALMGRLRAAASIERRDPAEALDTYFRDQRR